MENEVVSETEKIVEEPKAEVKADESQSPPAEVEEDTFPQDVDIAQQYADLMAARGFKSIEEVNEFLDVGSESIRFKKQMEAKLAEKHEQELRKNETPEETLARVEKQLQERDDYINATKREREEAIESQRVVESFYRDATGRIEKKGVPDHYKAPLKLLCGVENMFNSIDFEDPAQVQKMVDFNLKVLQDFESRIADNAAQKGNEIPPISEGGAPPAEGPIKPKSISEAGKLAFPILKNILSAKK